jgi:hypothetical protein
MKALATFALLTGLVSGPAVAQKLNLNFDTIARNAKEKTELNLEGPTLDMLKQTGPGLYASVDQVSLRNYEFAKPGEYAGSDLDALRKQLSSSAGCRA